MRTMLLRVTTGYYGLLKNTLHYYMILKVTKGYYGLLRIYNTILENALHGF
jgi:hypothetical protein